MGPGTTVLDGLLRNDGASQQAMALADCGQPSFEGGLCKNVIRTISL